MSGHRTHVHVQFLKGLSVRDTVIMSSEHMILKLMIVLILRRVILALTSLRDGSVAFAHFVGEVMQVLRFVERPIPTTYILRYSETQWNKHARCHVSSTAAHRK